MRCVGRIGGGDALWRFEDVKEAVSRKKEAYRAMYQNSAEENKSMYKSMKNKANKAVSTAMKEKAEKALNCITKLPKWDA